VWMMTASDIGHRPVVDMELADEPARFGVDMGRDHADLAEDGKRGRVAGVGEADEVGRLGFAEDPVPECRRRLGRIALPVMVLEQGVAYLRLTGGGIDSVSGAADEGSVRLAGEPELAEPPRLEQLDPAGERRLRLVAAPGLAVGAEIAGDVLRPMQSNEVVELIHAPAGH